MKFFFNFVCKDIDLKKENINDDNVIQPVDFCTFCSLDHRLNETNSSLSIDLF